MWGCVACHQIWTVELTDPGFVQMTGGTKEPQSFHSDPAGPVRSSRNAITHTTHDRLKLAGFLVSKGKSGQITCEVPDDLFFACGRGEFQEHVLVEIDCDLFETKGSLQIKKQCLEKMRSAFPESVIPEHR